MEKRIGMAQKKKNKKHIFKIVAASSFRIIKNVKLIYYWALIGDMQSGNSVTNDMKLHTQNGNQYKWGRKRWIKR